MHGVHYAYVIIVRTKGDVCAAQRWITATHDGHDVERREGHALLLDARREGAALECLRTVVGRPVRRKKRRTRARRREQDHRQRSLGVWDVGDPGARRNGSLELWYGRRETGPATSGQHDDDGCRTSREDQRQSLAYRGLRLHDGARGAVRPLRRAVHHHHDLALEVEIDEIVALRSLHPHAVAGEDHWPLGMALRGRKAGSEIDHRHHVPTNLQLTDSPAVADDDARRARKRLALQGHPLHVQAVASGLEPQVFDPSREEARRAIGVRGSRFATAHGIVGEGEQVAA